VLDLGGATTIGAVARGVVPAVGVERIGNRRAAQQRLHLLLALAHLELLDRGLLDQVALVDRLLVEDAAASGGGSEDGNQQEFAHGTGTVGNRADDTLPRTAATEL